MSTHLLTATEADVWRSRRSYRAVRAQHRLVVEGGIPLPRRAERVDLQRRGWPEDRATPTGSCCSARGKTRWRGVARLVVRCAVLRPDAAVSRRSLLNREY